MTVPHSTVIVTTATGSRLPHLARQREALALRAPQARQVVVMMDDAELDHPWLIRIRGGEQLPLARARNAGACAALTAGADLLIFLDIDCIPGADLVDRYQTAVRQYDALTCGMVTYLDPPPAGGYPLDSLVPRPHPARPVVDVDAVLPASYDDYRLFWSLSFAVSARRWRQIGGFCEDYVGYGGEDTDFGFLARSKQVPMIWLGGADAFHQHHAVSDPPWEHLDAIIANARTFHRRWGVWPMEGWLRQFASAGAIHWSEDAIRRT